MSDDEKSQLLSIIGELNNKIDDLNRQLSSPAVAKAQDEFTIKRLEIVSAAFKQQLMASNVLLILVVLVVVCGLVFSFIHLKNSTSNAKPTNIQISLTQLKITSGVLGLMILVISVAILFLYLKFVYTISTVSL